MRRASWSGFWGSFWRCISRASLLPEEQGAWLTALLAFIPARLSGLARELPGGEAASITQFVTHQFLHGDVTHLLINSAWFLAFGTSVARRTGAVRFLAFFLLCGIAGATLYAGLNAGALKHDDRRLGRHLRPHGRGDPLPAAAAERG